MILLLEVLAVLAVVFGIAVVLTGRGEPMSVEGRDLADTGIPRDRPMTPGDVVGLRFALAFRGYRMSEVDDALDRLAAELAARDEAIARLQATTAPEPAYEPAPEPEPVWMPPVLAETPAPPPVAVEPEPAPEPAPSPFRPEVPDIPTYDPWQVTPRSRYTEGPEHLEVEHHDEPDIEHPDDEDEPPPPITWPS